MGKFTENIKEEINAPILGHPSNQDSERIKRLEKIVIDLARIIDPHITTDLN